jgi:hypothetical protein
MQHAQPSRGVRQTMLFWRAFDSSQYNLKYHVPGDDELVSRSDRVRAQLVDSQTPDRLKYLPELAEQTPVGR